jgi:hypothetical protein
MRRDRNSRDRETSRAIAEKNARLEALGLRGGPSANDAICIHCGRPFKYGEGFIGSEVSLCDTCGD